MQTYVSSRVMRGFSLPWSIFLTPPPFETCVNQGCVKYFTFWDRRENENSIFCDVACNCSSFYFDAVGIYTHGLLVHIMFRNILSGFKMKNLIISESAKTTLGLMR